MNRHRWISGRAVWRAVRSAEQKNGSPQEKSRFQGILSVVKHGLAFLFWAMLCQAQTFYAVGLSVLPQTSPKPTGFLATIIPITKMQGIYNISEIDFTVIKGANGVLSIQTSPRTGAAVRMRSFGPVDLYALGDGGAATNGVNAGGAFAGGGFGVFPTKWAGIYGTIGARVLRTTIGGTQTLIEFGAVWGGAK